MCGLFMNLLHLDSDLFLRAFLPDLAHLRRPVKLLGSRSPPLLANARKGKSGEARQGRGRGNWEEVAVVRRAQPTAAAHSGSVARRHGRRFVNVADT